LAVAVPLSRPISQPAVAWKVIAPLVALHAVLFAIDLTHPERFLRADRAEERIEVIRGLAAAAAKGEALPYLAANGIVGDWLPQGLVYWLGGQYFLIALQVALALLSVIWVRDIGARAGLGERQAWSAAALYALLPHSLVFPHELASEAIFVPLVILAFRASALHSGVAIGLATLVRPLTLLWPLVQAGAPWLSARKRVVFLAAAFAPLLLWMAFVSTQTGEFSIGHSGHDLGTNLQARTQRMAASLPEQERAAVPPRDQKRISIGEYAAFAAAHPVVVGSYSARDMLIVVAKSGIERLTIDQLGLFPQVYAQVDDGSGWRPRLDKLGLLATLKEYVRAEPLLIGSSTAAALLFLFFIGLATVGAVGWLRSLRAVSLDQRVYRLLIAGFVLYVLITAQCVDYPQSRHRAPAEFALCVLAIAGWDALRRRLSEKRHGN